MEQVIVEQWVDMWFVYIMIGNVLWSITDVWASVMVNRVHSTPLVVSWFLKVLDLIILALLLLYNIPDPTWMPWVFLMAACSYLGTLSFYFSLSRVDVSVSNVAWLIMSVGIAVGGVFLFGETWTLTQGIGVLLVVVGMSLLTFWHKHISTLRTIALLAVPGLLFVPYFLIADAILLRGADPFDVFFWSVLFVALFSTMFPLGFAKHRQEICKVIQTYQFSIFAAIFPRSLCTATATYFVIIAYDSGLSSLVGIAENGQPFFIILFAWLATKLFPRYAPKELLSKESVGIKILSYCIAFVGLGLLAV